MSKKEKKKVVEAKVVTPPLASPASSPLISKRGWRIIGFGVVSVVLGFIVLTLTDPQGQNFASTLSPFLILGGYATVGFGIIAKDPAPPSPLA